jgi:hypothetical protein
MPPTLLYNRDTFSIHIFTLKVTDLIFDKLKLSRINIFRLETFPRSLFQTVCAQTDVKGSERKIVAEKNHTHTYTHTHRDTHTHPHTQRHTHTPTHTYIQTHVCFKKACLDFHACVT